MNNTVFLRSTLVIIFILMPLALKGMSLADENKLSIAGSGKKRSRMVDGDDQVRRRELKDLSRKRQRTLMRKRAQAYDSNAEKFTGSYEEACSLEWILLYDLNMKPQYRDLTRDKLQGILNDGDVNKRCMYVGWFNEEEYPLHEACRNDQYADLVDEFIARGANIKQIAMRNQGNILYSSANAPVNLQKMIQLLGSKKVKKIINASTGIWDTGGHDTLQTPLYSAARHLNQCSMTILLDNGADVNALNNERNTAIDCVICSYKMRSKDDEEFSKKIKGCLKLLLERGANVRIGNTKKVYCCSVYPHIIDEVFIQHGALDDLAYLKDNADKK